MLKMINKSSNGIHWLEFEILAQFPRLQHGVFLRHGGDSQGPYASLNLSQWMGDHPLHVSANIEKVKTVLNIPCLVERKQIHSNCIAVLKNSEKDQFLEESDGLLTHIKNIGLKVTHADCQAAIFYDPIEHIVAVVHCGWRGHVLNIYKSTIEMMKFKYLSQPENIFIAISPSLGPNHAEFINYKNEFPEVFWKFKDESDKFNLWELAIAQLASERILKSHIQIANICTYSNAKDCFSYRRQNRITGAHGTVAMLL